MRDLRTRIAQRHGIDLSVQQIQELAARRLEAVLDPRTVKPALLEELRRGAKAEANAPPAADTAGYDFTDTTIYESHRGFLRFARRLLNPLLMLFVNPNPIARALSAQTRINTEAAARAAEQERRLTEWNALLFDIIQRLVTEVSRASIEVQALTSRVESLSARVDFNDKRIRSLETVPPPGKPAPRPIESQPSAPAASPPATPAPDGASDTGDGSRRRRRRRRGRRPGVGWSEGAGGPVGGGAALATGEPGPDLDDADDLGDEAVTDSSLDVPAEPMADLGASSGRAPSTEADAGMSERVADRSPESATHAMDRDPSAGGWTSSSASAPAPPETPSAPGSLETSAPSAPEVRQPPDDPGTPAPTGPSTPDR